MFPSLGFSNYQDLGNLVLSEPQATLFIAAHSQKGAHILSVVWDVLSTAPAEPPPAPSPRAAALPTQESVDALP